jgi:hypothetical protein
MSRITFEGRRGSVPGKAGCRAFSDLVGKPSRKAMTP